MSYDFMMMKPKPERESEIESLEDLGEHTLLRQDPAALVEALSSLFPDIAWRNEYGGGWFGALKGDDSWYEFRIEAVPDTSWSIRTSHRAGTRNLVPWDATAAEAAIAIVAWGVGENVRARRRARAEQQAAASRLRALRDRDAASRERVELARELHDVVAHHVSLIAVKAATASYVTGSLPPAAVTAFDEIADQARTALTELRTVLGALREPGAPAAGTPLPGLDGLAELVESQQGHGTDVTLELAVRGPAPPGFVQVCVYRIVQEALTNARRHAPGSRVRVGVRVADGDLRVTVRDDGGGPGAGPGPGPARPEGHGRPAQERDGGGPAEPPGDGFGLRGIAERVAALGGRAQAGALPGGGFEVAAVIPLPEHVT